MALGTLFKAGIAIGGAALASDKLSSAINDAVEKSTNALNQAAGLPSGGSAQPNVGGTIGGALFGRNTNAKCIGCHAPMSGKAGTQYQCPYCDTIQTLG